MEPPPLTRTPSSLFSPGSHRRSHPNLHHLSLAPLTPKYPIDPADYDAYFDPNTSQLHTSTSISRIAAVPSPGGILTNSPVRSRANSRAALKRKTKSTVSIQAPTDTHPGGFPTGVVPSGALSSEGFGHRKTNVRKQNSSLWLVQTGLLLTEGSRESKGQSWISKRDSSTSLHTADEGFRSSRTTPNRSRQPSRRRSRKHLAMTPANTTPVEYPAPDWADSQTQAEIAQAEKDAQEEYGSESEDDDPYGFLDFEEDFDSEDEDEVKKTMSVYKLGWIDRVVDALLHLEDDNMEVMDEQKLEEPTKSTPPVQRSVPPEQIVDEPSELPPQEAQGLWADVRWFGRLVARTVVS